MLQPFHLAIPVNDLDSARAFYGALLGCDEGRSSAHWVDFNFFGHQLVCHLDPERAARAAAHSEVDGDDVPIPHFGLVLAMDEWKELRYRLQGSEVNFIIAPRIRFEGEVGEQATMFLTDAAGNALEFKAFADPERLFARDG